MTIQKVQKVFNAYIRKRDADKPCISCGGRIEQAGHFYSAGQFPALRFNEDNCHGQCVQCNYYKHGNLIPYQAELIRRIGEQRFLLLQSAATRSVHKWSRTELTELYKIYKQKLASLNK